MKKTISFILILCLICCNGLVPLAAGENEAKITSPSNGEWIDPYKTTTVKWTTPSSGLNYRVTIKNERTGKYIVQNEKVSGSSYSIKSNVLDFEERYVIWVGTYDGSTSLGHGDSITISVNDRNSSKKVYQEAEFSYPSNNQEISADKDLKITLNGNSDLAYNLTVKDTTSGKTIVNESGLTKISYTVKSSLLTEGHSYKAWVGTYKKASVEKKQFGAGKTVEFKTEKATKNEPPERPNAAEITSPSDKEWLDPTKKITIKWDTSSSDLEYCLTVKDDVSGEYIVNNEYTSKSSYNIKANTLTAEHRYKISLSTYADDTLIGTDEIYINMNAVDYTEADFSYPSDDDIVDSSSKLTLKFSDMNSDFCYRLSIIDADTGKSIIKNKAVSSNTYSLSANSLEQGKEYKLWIGTYINSSTSEAVGKGNTIYIYTKEEEKEIETATVEAVFSSPENNDIVNYKKDLTIKWEKSDVDTCFELTVKDTTDDSFIVKNEIVSGTSYKIKSSKLKAKHQYKAWIGTYNNSSDDKKLIGKGAEIYFSTDGTIPVLVKSLNADLEDKGLVFKYEFTGDNFGYATAIVADSNVKTLYNGKVYDLNGEIIIETDNLEENCTYTCEIQTYTSNGEKAAYKSQKYTVAKSGFSVTGVAKPTGELTYTKGFTVKGVVGSAYPITEAKIVIFTKGNENDIIDIVHLKNYNQTAKNSNQFNIKDYDSEVNFGSLTPGEYTYKVTVVDTMGNSYTAVESNFSIAREKGTYDDVSSDHKNYEAIKQLSLDGILSGDGTGKFRPNDSITRAEFVKMLYFAFNLSPMSSRDLRSSFSDVDTKHWAYTYIMSAFNKNIINGKGNGKFAPSDNVTFEEAAKMLICIKGWQDTAEQNGGWSGGGYITVANNNNFFASTSVSNGNYKRNASRADVAQMFYNALNKNTNDVVKADKIYTVNGVKLYAYKYTSGYYVDSSIVLPLLCGYDDKYNDLSGILKIWDDEVNIGLNIPYDLTSKKEGDYVTLEIKCSDGTLLKDSVYKNHYKKTNVVMTRKGNKSYINLDDIIWLNNYIIIDDNQILPDLVVDSVRTILDNDVIANPINEFGDKKWTFSGWQIGWTDKELEDYINYQEIWGDIAKCSLALFDGEGFDIFKRRINAMVDVLVMPSEEQMSDNIQSKIQQAENGDILINFGKYLSSYDEAFIDLIEVYDNSSKIKGVMEDITSSSSAIFTWADAYMETYEEVLSIQAVMECSEENRRIFEDFIDELPTEYKKNYSSAFQIISERLKEYENYNYGKMFLENIAEKGGSFAVQAGINSVVKKGLKNSGKGTFTYDVGTFALQIGRYAIDVVAKNQLEGIEKQGVFHALYDFNNIAYSRYVDLYNQRVQYLHDLPISYQEQLKNAAIISILSGNEARKTFVNARELMLTKSQLKKNEVGHQALLNYCDEVNFLLNKWKSATVK